MSAWHHKAGHYVGKSIYEALEAVVVKQVEKHYVATLKGEATTFDYESHRLGMTYRVRTFPAYNDQKQVIGGVVIANDVTEVLRTQSLIFAQERQYLAIVEDQTELICRYDANGLLTFVNSAFCRSFNTSVPAAIGTPFIRFFDQHGQEQLRKSVAMLSFEHASITNERMLHRSGEKPRWMRWTDRAIYSQDGILFQYQSIGHDITAQMEASSAEREQRELANALLDIAAVLNSTLNLSNVFKRILDNIGRVVPHDTANLMLIEGDMARVVRTRGYSAHAKAIVEKQQLSIIRTKHLEEMYRTGMVFNMPNVSEASSRWTLVSEGVTIRSYLGAPICLHGQIIGFLNLESRLPNAIQDVPDKWVQAFTDSAAIAIRNAQLYERAQNAAIVEERQSIARDLHDAVSQTLFSANMIADALPYMWERDIIGVQHKLKEMRQLTHHAMAELRTMLHELRPQTLVNTFFDDLVNQLTRSYGMRTPTAFTVESTGHEGTELPVDVKVALYRITQEAINNIVNHAEATSAHVHIDRTSQSLIVKITDNGKGFEIDRSYPGHHGLRIMRERSLKIGAQLNIRSRPSYGTCVTVTLQQFSGHQKCQIN